MKKHHENEKEGESVNDIPMSHSTAFNLESWNVHHRSADLCRESTVQEQVCPSGSYTPSSSNSFDFRPAQLFQNHSVDTTAKPCQTLPICQDVEEKQQEEDIK